MLIRKLTGYPYIDAGHAAPIHSNALNLKKMDWFLSLEVLRGWFCRYRWVLLRLLLRACQFRSSSHVDVDGQLCSVAIYGFALGIGWVGQM